MYKILIIVLLFVLQSNVYAEQPITYQLADSISYQHYMNGDWDKLINYGHEAIKQDVDFKNLRKRMGYAYFVKADYFKSQQQYEKALTFDESDVDVRIYLYYCGIYKGDNAYAQYHASKLTPEVQKSLGLKPFKIASAVDFEYNYKANDDSLGIRSNPTYYRIGISSQLGYRLNLYQAVSRYSQTVNVTTSTIQTEYCGLLNWALNSHSSVDIAFHYNNTNINTTIFTENMFFAQLSTRINHFRYGVNGSIYSNVMGNYTQIGLSGRWDLGTKGNAY